MCDLNSPQIGLILLAAGGSRRLGSPKQLVPDREGQSLIRRAAQTALGSDCHPAIIVLGASGSDIQSELSDLPVTLITNLDWQTGLASSLKTGLSALTAEGTPDAIIVMLCDQPRVTAPLLNSLIAAYHETGHQIIACEYGETAGVPALFGRSLFSALAALSGDEGARRVIRDYTGPITHIPFPGGSLDIDTPQDAQRLSSPPVPDNGGT